jgi:glycosyltransferase involved in cell wall biosynthesis
MTRVMHLIDDVGLGGVTRILEQHLPRLGNGFNHEIRCVAPAWRLPDPVAADIVIVHFTLNWSKLPFLAALRIRLPYARFVLVEHSYTEAYERLRVRRGRRFRAMLRLGYSMVNRVVAVSSAQAMWLRRAKLVSEGRLVAIPQACDMSALTKVLCASQKNGPLRLGAYGRYVPQKGFDVLIQAMRQVPASLATLELAGLGPDRADLEMAAEGLAHVKVGGPIDGPMEFLARVDAVVVPSRWEAFGLVAAEARAAARPVLAARTDGLVEQLDSRWGVLFSPEDPVALAAAIQSLASRDLAAMGAAARRSVDGALDMTIARWATLLNELTPISATWESASARLPVPADLQ